MILADRLFTGIRQLATLVPGEIPRRGPAMSELGIVEDAELAVREGRVAWIGRRRRRRREVRLRSGAAEVDLGEACVVPGFIDAHTHVLFGGDRSHELTMKVEGRSYLEIAQAGGGLLSTVRATRRASTEELRRSALARLLEMASGGTTAAEVKSGYALTLAGELRLLRLIPGLARSSGLQLVPTFLGAHAIPPEFADRADDYVDLLVKRMLPAVARERLARFCDVFCEPGFFSIEQSSRILRAALGLGLEVKIHADEFVYSGGSQLAAEMRARSAEHLLAAREEDRAALAAAGVTAVLLPVTPFASLSGTHSPGREMVDANVPVALGTDCSPNSWVVSMPLVLSHAVYSARLTPAESITAATVNAAHASGLTEVAGMLAPGRRADFSAFDVGSLEGIPYRVGARPVVVSRQGNIDSSR